jgi:hypothetical protein
MIVTLALIPHWSDHPIRDKLRSDRSCQADLSRYALRKMFDHHWSVINLELSMKRIELRPTKL